MSRLEVPTASAIAVLVEQVVPRNAAAGWFTSGDTAASGALPHAAVVAIAHQRNAIVMVRGVRIASVAEGVGKVEERRGGRALTAPSSHRVKTREDQTRVGKPVSFRGRRLGASASYGLHELFRRFAKTCWETPSCAISRACVALARDHENAAAPMMPDAMQRACCGSSQQAHFTVSASTTITTQ